MRKKNRIIGMDSNTDIQKFAEKLVKAGREAVALEQKKLEWLREEQITKVKSEAA
jgi:hypothetical protein